MNISESLELFKHEMIKEFKKHNDKYNDFDLNRNFNELKGIDPDYLRRELTYHYAKWLYSSVAHNDRPEENTLINLTNVIYMLWMQVREQKYKEVD